MSNGQQARYKSLIHTGRAQINGSTDELANIIHTALEVGCWGWRRRQGNGQT